MDNSHKLMLRQYCYETARRYKARRRKEVYVEMEALARDMLEALEASGTVIDDMAIEEAVKLADEQLRAEPAWAILLKGTPRMADVPRETSL